MASIHKLSRAIALPEFDLFTIPPTQAIVETDQRNEYRPLSTLSNNTPIEFEIRSSPNELIKLHTLKLYLRMKIKISKSNVNKSSEAVVQKTDWSKISPVNNFIHSLFKEIDVFINGKQISTSNQTYAYRAYFGSRFGYTNDAKKTTLTSALFYEDDYNALDEPNKMRSEKIASDNNDDFAEGREFEMTDILHIDLCLQPKVLLGGSTLKLKFIPHSPTFYLVHKNDIIPEVEFTEAMIKVHKSKIYDNVTRGLESGVNVSPAKYLLPFVKVVPYNLPSGTLDANINNAIHGNLPRRLFIMLVSTEAFNGSPSRNPFNFHHYYLGHVSVNIDGEQFPKSGYNVDFKKGLYLQAFDGFVEATNQTGINSTLGINRDTYAKGNCIFGFNFAPDLADSGCVAGHLSAMKQGSLNVKLIFKEPLKEPVNVLLVNEFDKLLEINNERNPEIDTN